MDDPISRTSRWTAAAPAMERARPDRLFDDPYAERLAGPEGFAWLERVGGDNPYIVIRTAFLDALILDAVREGGQVVLLAAGLDARPYRLALPAGVSWYELDRPDVLRKKAELLAAAAPRCDLRPVPTDLRGAWDADLRAAGFDPARPAVWIVEGLFVYLDEPTVRTLLERASTLAAPGSTLAFDVPGMTLLTSPLLSASLTLLEELGAPWRFGTDDPEGLVQSAGWSPTRVSCLGEPAASFGRWPYPTAPRGTLGVPQTYFVVARRDG